MKKITLITLLLSALFIVALAQTSNPAFRMQTPEETAFLNKVHQQLFDAIPHTYKTWKTDKEDSFDALKYWCRDEMDWAKCKGWILKSIGKSDPYALDWRGDFNMSDAESMPIIQGVFGMIKDYSNGPQMAAAIKSSNKTKLEIFVFANMYITGVSSSTPLSYCSKTPPVALSIPVPATLALKGIHSAGCPIMDGGSVSLHGDYYDNAVVFLGKPVTGKQTETTSDGLTTTRYELGFDRTKISKLIVQNIVVKFKGDSADIDEAIKLIDWQKLSSLIDK